VFDSFFFVGCKYDVLAFNNNEGSLSCLDLCEGLDNRDNDTARECECALLLLCV
jgi:hypothetical protein